VDVVAEAPAVADLGAKSLDSAATDLRTGGEADGFTAGSVDAGLLPDAAPDAPSELASRVSDAPPADLVADAPLVADVPSDAGPDSMADRPPDVPTDTRPDIGPDQGPDITPDAPSVLDVGTDAPVTGADAGDVGGIDAPADGPVGVDVGLDGPGGGTCSIGSTSAGAWAKRLPSGAYLSNGSGSGSIGGIAVGLDGARWAVGFYRGNLGSGGTLVGVDFVGAGAFLPMDPTTSNDNAFLIKVDPASGSATQQFGFVDPPGVTKDQHAVAVAVGQNGAVAVFGDYGGEIDFTADGGDGTDGVDYLAKPTAIAGTQMSYWVVADPTSTMPYITPIKAHNVDLGGGSFMAAASNPTINKAAVCGKTTRQAVTVVGTTNPVAYGYDSPKGTTAFQKGALTPFGGQTDIVVGVVDLTNGTLDWGKEFGGVGDQQCESIAIDASGNVYIAGNYNGALDFGNNHALPTLATGGLNVIYAAKFDSSGVCQAANAWGTGGASDAYAVALDGSGDVVIAGGIGVDANANFGGSVGTLSSIDQRDGFVVKLTSDFTTARWGFTFGDTAEDKGHGTNQQASAVGVTSTGDVIIAGSFVGHLAPLASFTSSAGMAHASAYDGFAAQLSGTNGSVTCAQQYSGGDTAAYHFVTAVTIAGVGAGDMADSIVMGGSFSGSITVGATTMNSSSSSNALSFIARLTH
jgi:hypothetical protein